MYPQQRAEIGTVPANPDRSPGGAGSMYDTRRRSPALQLLSRRRAREREPPLVRAGGLLRAREFEICLLRERSLADRGTRHFSLLSILPRSGRADLCRSAALEELGGRLRAGLRSTDVIGHWGGQRLGILLTDTDAPGAEAVSLWVAQTAERLGLQLEQTICVYPSVAEPGREQEPLRRRVHERALGYVWVTPAPARARRWAAEAEGAHGPPAGRLRRGDGVAESTALEVLQARERLVSLRELLPAVGYTTESVRQQLQIPEPVKTIISNTGRYSMFYLEDLERTAAPAAVIAQLFLFGGRTSVRRFERLPKALLSLLRDCALVEVVPDARDELRSSVSITEVEGRYFLSDKLFENQGGGEFVIHSDPARCMPPHASSLELMARLTTPPGARSLLDVGAGSGCQSILRATHYERLAGFDVSPRSVEFARANATLNGVEVSYSVADLRSFAEGAPYDHIAHNGDPEDVFTFINESMDRLLAPAGTAQVWTHIPVTLSQGNIDGTLRERLHAYAELAIDVTVIDMPFSLSREQMQARKLPRDSLLIAHPSEREAFFSRLVKAGVIEIVPVVLTIRRRS